MSDRTRSRHSRIQTKTSRDRRGQSVASLASLDSQTWGHSTTCPRVCNTVASGRYHRKAQLTSKLYCSTPKTEEMRLYIRSLKTRFQSRTYQSKTEMRKRKGKSRLSPQSFASHSLPSNLHFHKKISGLPVRGQHRLDKFLIWSMRMTQARVDHWRLRQLCQKSLYRRLHSPLRWGTYLALRA